MLAECPLYYELEEIYGQNPALNPPFTRVLGGINSNGDSDEPVASEEESEASPSSLSPIQKFDDRLFDWSDSPPQRSPTPRASHGQRIPSPLVQDDDDSLDDFTPLNISQRHSISTQPRERRSSLATSLPPLARKEKQRCGTSKSNSLTDNDVLADLRANERAQPGCCRGDKDGTGQDILALIEQQKEILEVKEREKTRRRKMKIDADKEIKLAQLELERERFEMQKKALERGDQVNFLK